MLQEFTRNYKYSQYNSITAIYCLSSCGKIVIWQLGSRTSPATTNGGPIMAVACGTRAFGSVQASEFLSFGQSLFGPWPLGMAILVKGSMTG